MKISATVFLGLILFFGVAASAHAQGSQWEMLNNEAMPLYQKGRYDHAVVVPKKALDVSEKVLGPNHPTVATLVNNLAALYSAQGQYAQAEPLFKRALAIGEKALGPDHPNVATSLNNLAALYRKTVGTAKRKQWRRVRLASAT